MNWTALDWKTLDRLREGFLSGSAAKGPYWKSRDDLAHYDATYAERIGWKWDAVLAELRARGGAYAQALAEGRPVRVAINQVMARADTPLSEGAEVGLFPPVTGG